MTISSGEVLRRIDSITLPLQVRLCSGTRELLFLADRDRVEELCSKGQVAGSARGRHIRYLELLVPLDEVAREFHVQRASTGCVGEDSRTVSRGEDILANNYSHNFRVCGAYAGSSKAYRSCGDGVGR